jgi:hypothetical protein
MRHPPDYPAKTLVTAQWQWSGYSAPDQENKEINVDIAVVLRWRDDRVNPELVPCQSVMNRCAEGVGPEALLSDATDLLALVLAHAAGRAGRST